MSIMDDALFPAAAAAAANAGQAGTLETTAASEQQVQVPPGAAPDALSDKEASTHPVPLPFQQGGHHDHHHLVLARSDKDTVPEPHIQRQDTLDSYRSSFGHRTNTGWTTNASTATDFTEPDLATLNDDLLEDHPYASSPRPFSSALSRSVTFQSSPPTRVSSFALNETDKRAPSSSDDVPTPKHSGIRRLQEMSSPRRGRQPSHPGPGPTPRRGSHSSINPPVVPSGLSRAADEGYRERSASPPNSPEPSRLITRDLPIRVKTEAPMRSASQSQGGAVVDSIPEEVEPSTAIPIDDDDEIPEELYASQMSDFSDYAWEPSPATAPPSHKSDAQVIHDVCDKVLTHVFGVELQDLAGTDAASAAYNSVSYCLDELANIVSAHGPAICELAPRGGGGSSHPTIRPAGSGSQQGGSNGGGSGSGSGGGGGRPLKRQPDDSNDANRDGSDNNGDGSGGGKKRVKVNPDQPSQQEDHHLSCPFRKRNPVKFNVRDHQSCAVQSFPDISLLK